MAAARILYGAPSSSRTNKVTWMAAELGLSYSHVKRPTSLLRADPAYLRLNPKATVPTYVERSGASEFVLNESNSIVAYLARRYGGRGSLYPASIERAALCWQWQEYGESSIQPACSPVWWGYMSGSGYPLGPGGALVPLDHDRLAAASDKALAAFSVLNSHLSDGRSFMLGEDLT
ncbi:MAG: hypothetical protein SGPRY_014078, partial [Prymnesium sp.]